MLRVNRVSRFAASDSNGARESNGSHESTAADIGEFERHFSACEADLQAFVFTLLPHWPDAEDIVQRTRIVLWQKFAQFRPESSFRAWAMQIARFEVSNFRRTKRSDHLTFDDQLVDSLAEVRSALAEELDRRRAALEHCLRKLRASDRQIIRHCYGPNSTTTKDAADRLHRPVNTLYKALNRIRRTLMECVQLDASDER
jgi:RNA polymerase sigma-70 factor (ECF subfamily)